MKKAVILFNLGGPDKLENVEPFLFNLFNDPAILNLPSFFRYPLAKLIANRRAPTATKIYEELREKTNSNKSSRESDHFKRESCSLLVRFTKPVKFLCILGGYYGYFFFSEAFNLSYKSTCVNYVCRFIDLASKWDWTEIRGVSF